MGILESFARELHTAPAPAARVQTARLAALAHARTQGIPDTSAEEWKYTDLSALSRQEFSFAQSLDLDPATLPLATLNAHRLVFINGYFSAAQSALGELPPGVSVRTISDLSAHEPAWLAEQIDRQGARDATTFAALNAAGTRDGAYLELAADSRLTLPLLVIFVTAAGDRTLLSTPHLRIAAGAHSAATVLEVHTGQGEGAYLSNAYTRIETSRGARIAHYRVVCESARATHVGQVQIDIGTDCTVENFALALGGRTIRVDIACNLAAPGGTGMLNGVFLAGTGQHVDHHTRIDHRASHTTSDEIYKGIADGDGRGVFNGQIVVHPGTEKIVATQASNNLLLSSDAEIDTKPELEIYADDLRCAHGATVGQLDDDALFYLRARGVPESEARALLTYGFVQESLSAIPVPELQALVARRFATDNPALARILAGDPS